MKDNTAAKVKLTGIRVAPLHEDCNRRSKMIRQIARELMVSRSTVQRWYSIYKRQQSL